MLLQGWLRVNPLQTHRSMKTLSFRALTRNPQVARDRSQDEGGHDNDQTEKNSQGQEGGPPPVESVLSIGFPGRGAPGWGGFKHRIVLQARASILSLWTLIVAHGSWRFISLSCSKAFSPSPAQYRTGILRFDWRNHQVILGTSFAMLSSSGHGVVL